MKLEPGELRLLQLVHDEALTSPDGWAAVSGYVWPLMQKLPADLITLKPSPDGGGKCALTTRGDAVVQYSM